MFFSKLQAHWHRLLQSQRIAAPALIYFVAATLPRIASLILLPLYSRRLSATDYGQYGLAQTAIAFLPPVLSLGLSAAVSRFYFDNQDRQAAVRRVGGISRWLLVVSATLAAVIEIPVLLFAPVRIGLFGRWELSCIIWAGWGSVVAQIPPLYLKSAQRPFAAAAFQVTQFVALLCSGLLLVGYFHRGLRGTIEASAIAYLLDSVVSLVFVLLALKGEMKESLLWEGVRLSVPFVFHLVASSMQQWGDRWVLEVCDLKPELGRYTAAQTVVSPGSMAVAAWNEASAVEIGEIFRAGGAAALRRRLRSFVLSFAGIGLGSSVLIGAGVPIFWVLVSTNLHSAFALVPLLCLSVIVEALYYPGALVLFYLGRTWIIPAATISSAIVNIVAGLLLARQFGLVGALLGRLISMSLRSVLLLMAARYYSLKAT